MVVSKKYWKGIAKYIGDGLGGQRCYKDDVGDNHPLANKKIPGNSPNFMKDNSSIKY